MLGKARLGPALTGEQYTFMPIASAFYRLIDL